MKKVLKKLLIVTMVIGLLFTIVGCSKQDKAKNFGGTYEMKLPKGKKLVNITFKDSDIWYLTRDMKSDEQAETYEFAEDSNLGLMEGKIIIKEEK